MRAITLMDRELHSACERDQWVLLRLAPANPNSKSSPYGILHEPLQVQERLWISDCGKYYAQHACQSNGEWWYDVMSIDGSQRWFWGRYVPTGWNDTDPRYLYPEFSHMVSYWGNRGRTLRSGRFIQAFELGFGDYDTSTLIKPFQGNTQLASYRAVFHRRIRGAQMPEWAGQVSIVLTERAVRPFEDVLHAWGSDWKELYWTFHERYGNVIVQKKPLVWEFSYRRFSLKDHAELAGPSTSVKVSFGLREEQG